MAKGKLTQTEKYTIQGMLHSQKTIEEIAQLTERSITCVKNYVEGELDALHTTIAKAQLDANGPTPEDIPVAPIKPDLTKLTSSVPKGQAKRNLVHKTFGGKDGVVVMTPSASQVGDEFIKTINKKISRTSKGNIFDTEGNKIE